METTKPLNPSNNPGEADDLIEELARMMAAGAKDKVAGATNTLSGSGAPASGSPAPSGFAQTKPESGQAGQTGMADASPLAASSGALSGMSAAEKTEFAPTPRKSPPPYRVPTPDVAFGAASDDIGKSPGFGLNLAGDTSGGNQQHSASATPSPLSSSSSDPTPDGAAGDDPIADLIRQGMQPATSAPPQGATSAPTSPVPGAAPAQPQASGAKSGDGFRVPPVFGLGGPVSSPAPVPSITPASASSTPVKPLGGSTALDEIEKLIGNAVHVDLPEEADLAEAMDTPENPAASAEPALQPDVPQGSNPRQNLFAQPPVPQPVETPPQAASIVTPVGASGPPADSVEAAEAAILQAMGAAGQSGTLPNDAAAPGEAPLYEEPLLAGAYVAPQKKPKNAVRRYVVPVIAVLLLGAAGVGGYYFLNSGNVDAEAPVLVADGTPDKTIPEPQTPASSDQSVVFEGIDGSTVPDTEQRLVSRDQTDGAPVSDIRQVITIDNSEAGLANRRVRTVTVRPDGTIISGDDAVAGGEVLPVAQPNLPELPASAIDSVLAGTTVAALPESADLTASAEPPATTIQAASANGNRIVSVNGTTVPFPRPRIENRATLAAQARANSLNTNSVAPTAPPAVPVNSGAVDLLTALTGQPESAPPTPVNIVAPPPAPIAQPVPIAQPAQQTTVSNSYVQLASLRAQAVAEQTAANLQRRYAAALGGGSLVVRRVDLGDRGVFFRVLLPTASLSEASAVCTNIQNVGGDCFPRNN